MSDSDSKRPTVPWIHIGECPVCGNGLCRVRCGARADGSVGLYAMCDECEAIWLKPDILGPYQFPDTEDPVCPVSGEAIYGPGSRWATTEDVRETDWESEVVIDLPGDLPDQSGSESFVTSEDQASALDVPPLSSAFDEPEKKPVDLHSDDWAYGQDEPRPGC